MFLPVIASGTTVLLLKDGGTLEGELLNPNEISRKSYRIKTAGGLEVSLDAKLVDRILSRERPALIEYNANVHLTENTLENHLNWARWCNENQLYDQAKLHWQQVLELDSDYAEARQVLGYVKEQDGWVSLREKRESRGYIQERGGRWRTAQQIEVANILETQKNAVTHWRSTIRDLCRRLPNSQAEAALLAIRDPAAFEPMRDILANEGNPNVRRVLIRSLIRIPHTGAVLYVVGWSINPREPFDDIRQLCVDELLQISKEKPEIRQLMIDSYRGVLRPTIQPAIMDMVAKVLGDIGAHEAVPELIDVLVVPRTHTIQEQPQPYSFGTGGTSLGQGSKRINRTEQVPNSTVLTALTKLTGLNFLYDQARWREEYRKTQRSPSFNLRRD